MPAIPGSTYTVTSTISGWTGTNTHNGTDATSSILTIDNLSPNDATNATGTPSATQVALSWTSSNSSDINTTIILRATSTINNSPTEGSAYATSTLIGTSTIIYTGSSSVSGIKVGGVWRFDRKEVDAWLKTKRRSSR